MQKLFKWIYKFRTHCPELGPVLSFKNLVAGFTEAEWKIVRGGFFAFFLFGLPIIEALLWSAASPVFGWPATPWNSIWSNWEIPALIFWVLGNMLLWVGMIFAALSFITGLLVITGTVAIMGVMCSWSIVVWHGARASIRYVFRPSKIPIGIYRLCLRGRRKRLRAKGLKKEVIGVFRQEEKLRELVPPSSLPKNIKKI